MFSGQREKLQVQPPKAKIPLSGMAVGALEIGTAALGSGWDIPAPTALVRNEWQVIMPRHLLRKGRVCLNGFQPVGDGQGRATQRRENLRDGLLCRREMQRVQSRKRVRRPHVHCGAKYLQFCRVVLWGRTASIESDWICPVQEYGRDR